MPVQQKAITYQPVPAYFQLNTWKQTSVKFESKDDILHKKNAIENIVSILVAILSQPPYVKSSPPSFTYMCQ